MQNGEKEFPITDYRMTRFWIGLTQGVELVIKALEEAKGEKHLLARFLLLKLLTWRRL